MCMIWMEMAGRLLSSDLELIRVVWARTDLGGSSMQIRANAPWPVSIVERASHFIE